MSAVVRLNKNIKLQAIKSNNEKDAKTFHRAEHTTRQ